MIRILVALACLIFAVPASAQETEAETRSLFTNFIQNQLSTPNRQIQISGIQGALSSNARIASITVADREGVWLRITNASIEWSRTALLLRQRLEIASLRADRIDVIRRPVPEEGMPPPESSGFAVPELPVAINLESLEIPVATFGPAVFGLESELSLTGRLRLEDGSIDTALDVTRLDGPGGQLGLSFIYSNATEIVDLDLSLSEPENGIVANLLNIEGKPPVDLTLAGNGELDNLDVELTLDADDERILTGVAILREGRGGRGFSTRLSGPVAQLIPAQFRDFFGAETSLEAQGFIRAEGGFRLDALDLQSAALALSASAETTADSFLRRLAIDASVEDPSGDVVVLPVPGGDTTVQRASLTLSYGEGADDDWSGSLDIRGLDTASFAAETMELDLSGLAQNLDQPNDRRITFDLSGAIDGVTSPDEEIAQALGTRIDLSSSGQWASSQPLVLSDTQIEAEALILRLAGTVAAYVFDGDIGVETSSLAPFSGLAGRDLSGALALDARGSVAPISGGFNLTLDGTIDELRIDQEAADNLMGGRTTIAGRIERGENGLVTDDLRVENQQFDLLADGTYATGAADFDFRFGLTDLALVSPQASGALTAEGRAAGSDGLINLTTSVTVPSGRLADKQLRDAAIAFEGTLEGSDLDGSLAGSAFLDGVRVDLSSAIALVEEERRLTDLVFTAGGARLTGNVVQDSAGLLTGSLDIDAADISTLAALALQEASGTVQASIGLEPVENEQRATLEGTIDDFVLGETSIEAAEIQAAIDDLFGVPRIDGSVDASGISAGGVDVTTLQANASRRGEATDFSANARLDNGTTAAAEGSLTPEGDGFRLALTRIDLAQGQLAARLRQPASLTVIGETITIDALALDVGGGSIDATGRIAERIDLDVTIAALPLSIANTVRPDLELGGTIDGTARVTGPRNQPDVAFDIRGTALQAAALRDAGLSSLGVTARGTTSGERLNVDARATSPEGLDASVRGSAPLGEGQLALDVTLAAFPLGILNTVVPDQNLGGNLSGTARVTGTTSDPQAAFNLSASGLSARPLSEAGIGALNATAAGNFANQTVTLSSVNVSSNQGLSLSASGTVPLQGAGLAVNLSGEAPLSLANRFLIDRGTQLVGTVGLQGQVTGSISDPQIRGAVSTQGAQIVDPETNISLRGINVSASIDGQTITIQSANATLGAGGTVTAGGTISLGEGLPADITIALNQARYNDGDLIAATVSGNLAFTGPLAADARLSGTINIERAEISVPENLGGGAAGIDVIHRNPPPGVAATLERARANDGTPVPTARPSVIQLDVTVNAPNQIFVRGRGLDAELGGSVRVLGPVTNVQPVGAFELIRGRLSILGQRIEFEEGTITLVGDLDPVLNFVASSQSDGTTVFIRVSGRVSDLDISFSSSPQLPEDEVLARLIFNRSLSELSAFQIAQLAAAAAELAGGGNSSLLGSLRSATGLDDLDIVTDSEGNAAVRAGRYIQDNIYLGVEAGAGGTARGTINLDITDELKARGAVGSDGDSSLGVFFERDY
ncbi:translocation/assembly module TamB domain-containing protein [Mesorhizobium sp. YIM 152430]|uniref:translocation/assembly module TamB domain-containing protein n=1 Tax=Mesorhizobium sp. YIM 152430 TaxID=3031761 RepID=UPI0023DCBF63|nr:translocation/assembly module TamB domain-containing protein [Mesorhizobium sp. YIM 152430]MDF1599839.1 translocation/assembly module TamB domain-containing protein [Mesorhizobium sp. YIM 152430]